MGASALSAKGANPQTQNRQEETGARRAGRAVLDAATFSPGPTSGAQLGGAPINGHAAPYGQRKTRSPQNPFTEEASAVRVMNAMRKHAQSQGARKIPVFSPWHLMLDDGNPDTFVDNRKAPPAGSGLKPASSEIFNVGAIQRAGYPVVVWTVNDKPRMLELMRLGVNGIISDRPDLLRQAVEEFDANGDGTPGDSINSDGLIELSKFDAQGHRGGRDLRPENTLPAMEVALDNLMSTLELDTGITSDRTPVVDHDPLVQSEKCRRADGAPYT